MPSRRAPVVFVLHQFVAGTLGVCLWSLVAAFLLRFAERAVEKREEPFPYAVAFAISIYVNLITYSVAWGALVLAVALAEADSATLAAAMTISVGFLLQAKVTAHRLDLAFRRACVVSFIAFFAVLVAELIGLAFLYTDGRWAQPILAHS
jgi:hypothetical protein